MFALGTGHQWLWKLRCLVENLRAYYLMRYFGIVREVRAVDDISLEVRRNEIYGLAGESSSGKTTFIKTIAAIRPPLEVVGGSIKYSFLDRDIYGLSPKHFPRSVEASVVHHPGFDECPEPDPPGAAILHRLRPSPHGPVKE